MIEKNGQGSVTDALVKSNCEAMQIELSQIGGCAPTMSLTFASSQVGDGFLGDKRFSASPDDFLISAISRKNCIYPEK